MKEPIAYDGGKPLIYKMDGVFWIETEAGAIVISRSAALKVAFAIIEELDASEGMGGKDYDRLAKILEPTEEKQPIAQQKSNLMNPPTAYNNVLDKDDRPLEVGALYRRNHRLDFKVLESCSRASIGGCDNASIWINFADGSSFAVEETAWGSNKYQTWLERQS